MAASEEPGSAPARQGLVLTTLILVAAVANLNLTVANTALPDIGKSLDASQTALDLIAVGFSLGLAASVLYLGALGDRYGRKLMLVLGTALSIPAAILAASASSVGVLVGARIFGGLAAGMAFPTTLALITALWSGPGRTKAIALWSGIGASMSALGPLLSGRDPRAPRVGLGVPAHAAVRGARARAGDPVRAEPRQRDHRAGRQPRRDPLDRARRRARARDQLRAGPGKGDARPDPRGGRARRARRLLPAPATHEVPAVRPRTWPPGASSGSRRSAGSSCSAA